MRAGGDRDIESNLVVVRSASRHRRDRATDVFMLDFAGFFCCDIAIARELQPHAIVIQAFRSRRTEKT